MSELASSKAVLTVFTLLPIDHTLLALVELAKDDHDAAVRGKKRPHVRGHVDQICWNTSLAYLSNVNPTIF